eukprot:gene6627-7704_t
MTHNIYIYLFVAALAVVTYTQADTITITLQPSSKNYDFGCAVSTDGCPDIPSAILSYVSNYAAITDTLLIKSPVDLVGVNNTNIQVASPLKIIMDGFNVDLGGQGTFLNLTQDIGSTTKTSVTLQNMQIANGFTNSDGAVITASTVKKSRIGQSSIKITIDSCSFDNNNANGNGGVVAFVSDETDATLTLTVTNSQFTGNSAGNTKDSNGAAFFTSNVVVDVTDSVFTQHKLGTAKGNGVIYSSYGSLDITNSQFSNNKIPRASIVTLIQAVDTATMQNVTFQDNEFDDAGFMLFMYASSLSVLDSTFTANHQSSAIYMSIRGSLLVSNSYFQGHAGTIYGGVLRADSGTTFMLTNSLFMQNSAQYGGAVSANGVVTGTTTNCTFESNTASQYGGAIYANRTTLSVSGGSLVSNDSPFGDDIFCQDSTITLKNITRVAIEDASPIIACKSSSSCTMKGDASLLPESCVYSTKKKSKLSPGAIAGIIIGCIVGLALIIALALFIKHRLVKRDDTYRLLVPKSAKEKDGFRSAFGRLQSFVDAPMHMVNVIMALSGCLETLTRIDINFWLDKRSIRFVGRLALKAPQLESLDITVDFYEDHEEEKHTPFVQSLQKPPQA